MSWTAAALVLYVALQIALSSYVARKMKTEADYLVAGRNVGVGLAAVSLFATWFGAETVMGSSGAVAAGGISAGRADPFGYSLCLVLMALLLAYKLRSRNYVTSADFFRDRFGPRVEKLAVVVLVPTSLIWASAQILAFATIFSSVTDVPMGISLVFTVVALITYSSLGGMIGDIITDTVEGAVITIGLLVMMLIVIAQAGGWGASFAAIPAARFSLLTPDESLWTQLDSWAIPILGSLVAQEALSRLFAARSPQVARQACLLGAGLYLTIGIIPLVIGLIGGTLIAVPEDSDAFLPALAEAILHPVPYVLLMGALISAILSTINSTLLAVTGLVGHNIVVPLLPQAGERKKLMIQKGIVVGAGIVCYLLAASGESIYSLVELSSSFGAAGVLVCVLAGLYTRFGGPWAAFATLAGGMVIKFAADSLGVEAPFIVTLAGCTMVYFAVGLAESRSVKSLSSA